MPDFVLTLLDSGTWQGPKGTEITVKVQSTDVNLAIQGAVYSGANPTNLTLTNGVATVKLSQGGQVLTVAINHVFPVADWQVNATDANGVSKNLAAVLSIQNLPDPYSLNINLEGK